MSVDYSKLRTPFFKIKISDPQRIRSVDLPQHLLKLVSKIDIRESIQEKTYDYFEITFFEGSREPAPITYTGIGKGLYPLDGEIKGSITNRIGSLADLRFSGKHGITFLTSAEEKSGYLETNRRYSNDPKPVRFLFQQHNLVKVTWGYVEEPRLTRSIECPISVISADFPEDDQPIFKITCNLEVFYNNKKPQEGISFRRLLKVDPNAEIYEFEDIPTGEMIQTICDKAGLDCIISDNLPDDVLESHKAKSNPAGESFYQFLTRIGKKNNVVPKIITNTSNNKDTVIFVTKKDWEAKILGRFTYGAPNDIVKSIKVSVDYAGLTGVTNKNLTEDGELNNLSAEHGSETLTIIEPNKVIGTNPAVGSGADSLHKTNYNGNVSGTVITKPETKELHLDGTHVEAEWKNRKISLNMTTVGYPMLVPGKYIIDGIGVRYSGDYRVIQVRHMISDSGYITEAMANNFSNAFGDIDPDGATKDKDKQETLKLKFGLKIQEKYGPPSPQKLEYINKLRGKF